MSIGFTQAAALIYVTTPERHAIRQTPQLFLSARPNASRVSTFDSDY